MSASAKIAPHNILVGAPNHVELVGAMRAKRPDLEYRGAPTNEVTQENLTWADTFVGFRRPRKAKTMGGVRWVHSTGAGVDPWLAHPALDPVILLTRSSESFGPMIAEWAVARVLAFQQQLLELASAQREQKWAPREVARLAGTRALVLGTGDIGSAVASSLVALGVKVEGISRSGRAANPDFARVHTAEALPGLVGDVQWIVVTLPDTPATRGLVSREVLANCRGAVLLNAGRGSVVDEGALAEALAKGWLRGVALDVFHVEPLPADSPLWRDWRVMISPHISGITTIEGAVAGFLECLADIEAGRRSRWTVDRTRGY